MPERVCLFRLPAGLRRAPRRGAVGGPRRAAPPPGTLGAGRAGARRGYTPILYFNGRALNYVFEPLMCLSVLATRSAESSTRAQRAGWFHGWLARDSSLW